MKKKAAFKATIKLGFIDYDKPLEVSKFVVENNGKDIVVRIEEIGDDVSEKQRTYYFATNRFLIRETEIFRGWSEPMVDAYACDMFLSEIIELMEGKEMAKFKYTRSVSKIDKEEMKEFITKWLDYLSFSHGIYCASPEEILLSKYSQ